MRALRSRKASRVILESSELESARVRRYLRASHVPREELFRVVEAEHVVVILDVVLGQERVDLIELEACVDAPTCETQYHEQRAFHHHTTTPSLSLSLSLARSLALVRFDDASKSTKHTPMPCGRV